MAASCGSRRIHGHGRCHDRLRFGRVVIKSLVNGPSQVSRVTVGRYANVNRVEQKVANRLLIFTDMTDIIDGQVS